jgi:hypothetical protein
LGQVANEFYNRFFDKRYYKQQVVSNNDGFVFKDTNNETSYGWDQIRHIIFGPAGCISIIGKDGNRTDGIMPLGRGTKKRKSKIEAIWNQWADYIPEAQSKELEYPVEEQKKDMLKEKFANWFCVFLGIVLLLSALYFLLFAHAEGKLDKWLKIFFYIPLCFVASFFIVGGILDMRSGTKIPSSIAIGSDGIFVRYANGRCREFDKGKLYSYSINSESCEALVVFRGGATVKHIEKVSYFPVLRKHLLEMMNKS